MVEEVDDLFEGGVRSEVVDVVADVGKDALLAVDVAEIAVSAATTPSRPFPGAAMLRHALLLGVSHASLIGTKAIR